MLWSLKLQNVKRYRGQRFWERESLAAEHAALIDPLPQLENVAAHSWHVADTVLLLGPRFPGIDLFRCLRLALLHDKLEIVTGDSSPVGRDKLCERSHAFDQLKRYAKQRAEKVALAIYVKKLPQPSRNLQAKDLLEIISGTSAEIQFVRSVDKLQALAYVLLKKRGDFANEHLRFTLKYSAKAVDHFPSIAPYYANLKERLLHQVSRRRHVTYAALLAELTDHQLELPLPSPE